jgi:hypothetical protein
MQKCSNLVYGYSECVLSDFAFLTQTKIKVAEQVGKPLMSEAVKIRWFHSLKMWIDVNCEFNLRSPCKERRIKSLSVFLRE